MNKKIPIYQIEIDENDETTGVDFISLVDESAMELNWLKFNKEVKLEFKADKDKKLLYGVFIVPDKMIYRSDDRLGEYYTYFSKDTIEKIVRKFNKNNYNKNINFQHGDNRVNGFVVENFITSPMLKADFGFEVPEGSWVGSVYIEDDNFWQSYIKNGDLNGFSVEIISKLQKMDMSKISFDFDDTLTKKSIQDLAINLIEDGNDVHIITRRQERDSKEVYDIADKIGIPHSKVHFTNGKLKWEEVKKLGIDKHYDNNSNEIEKIKENTKADTELVMSNNFAEVYTDYPQAATENAKIALRWAEKNGWGSCGTPVGKTRANQLANREGISRETISRMAAFERHRQNSQKALGDGCGRLMWLAWGGDEGVAWAQRKLEQIDKQKLSKVEKIDKLYGEMIDILNSNQSINQVYDRLENLFKK